MSHLKSVALIIAGAAALAVPGMALAAPPPNDDFADRQAISGLAGTIEGSNVEATYEVDEPDHAAEPPTVSVWYRWTAPGDGAVTFDLCGSDFDTILAVYTGSALASLTGIAANDDSFDDACGFRASRSTFTAVAGTEYLIAVDGYLGDTGSFGLRWTPPRPTNLERPAVSGAATEGGVLTVSAGQWQSGLATTLSYQWQRCGRLDYPAANVALGRPGIATTSHPEHPPAHAVDGNLSTFWSSDAPAPQRIEIDLGAPYPVNRIRSAVMQSSGGFTDHRILGRGPQPGDAYHLLTELSGNTSDNQVLEWVPTGGWVNGVQFIRFETGMSPSIVAWRELEAYANCINLDGATAGTYGVTRADVGYMLRAVVTATSAAGATTSASTFSDVVPYVAPENIARPAVFGNAKLRGILTATPGQWRGTQPLSFAFEWQRCTAAGACSAIPGETRTQLNVTNRDVGSSIRVVVTARNDAGSTLAASDATARIPAVCRVPGVKGRTLVAAKRALARGHCRLGRVKRTYSRRVKRGRVISQTPAAGAERPAGTTVRLVVSRGRRR